MNSLLYLTDRGYLGPTLASILSVREVWPLDSPLSVVVGFDGALKDSELQILYRWALDQSFDLSIVSIGKWLDTLELPMGTRLQKRHTRTVWGVLWLSEIIEDRASHVLYMDGDCMAVRDPSGLFEIDLSGFVAGAVRDDPVPTVSSEFGVPMWEAVGMAEGDPYFNSGVLLVDVGAWRSTGIGELARETLATYGRAPEQYDQEILNIALWSRWRELATIWNTTSWWFRPERRVCGREGVLEEAAIIHFSGPMKPWSDGAMLNQYSERFKKCLADVGEVVSALRVKVTSAEGL